MHTIEYTCACPRMIFILYDYTCAYHWIHMCHLLYTCAYHWIRIRFIPYKFLPSPCLYTCAYYWIHMCPLPKIPALCLLLDVLQWSSNTIQRWTPLNSHFVVHKSLILKLNLRKNCWVYEATPPLGGPPQLSLYISHLSNIKIGFEKNLLDIDKWFVRFAKFPLKKMIFPC